MMVEMKQNDNPIAFSIVKITMKDTWDDTINSLKKAMKKPMAETIKLWRVGEGPDDINTYSWRAITHLFIEKYPKWASDNNILAGNQVSGMLLCEAAMLKLKETVEQGWT